MNNNISLPLIGYIELTRGQRAIVDWVDVDWLSNCKWQCNFQGYAVRSGGHWMHVEIMRYHGIEPGNYDVDHIDGNPLNNRLLNLRLATRSQNCINTGKPKNNTSGFKGVSFHQKTSKWIARIGYQCERKFLGYYSTAEEAAKAYNKAAIELFGEYALLNTFENGTPLGVLEEEYATRVPQSKKTSAKTTSKYKGVSPTSSSKNTLTPKWLSQIWFKGKRKYLGTYLSQEDAAYIYNQFSILLFGKNAVINELPENYEPSELVKQIPCHSFELP